MNNLTPKNYNWSRGIACYARRTFIKKGHSTLCPYSVIKLLGREK